MTSEIDVKIEMCVNLLGEIKQEARKDQAALEFMCRQVKNDNRRKSEKWKGRS